MVSIKGKNVRFPVSGRSGTKKIFLFEVGKFSDNTHIWGKLYLYLMSTHQARISHRANYIKPIAN